MARQTLRSQLEEQQAALTGLQAQYDELKAHEQQVLMSNAMLERKIEDLSYIDLNNILSASDEVLPQVKRVETIQRIRRLRHENPMAKQAIKLPLRFVYGKGIAYSVDEPNTDRIFGAFWNDPINQAVWTSHFMQVVHFDQELTDGEEFIVMVATPFAAPYARLGMIPMEQVTDIIYDPDNDWVPVYYRRVYRPRRWDANLNNRQGGWVTDPNVEPVVRYYRDWRVSDDYLDDLRDRGLAIPDGLVGKGVVKHRMVNPVKMRSGFRGVSELFASREWFRVFKEFMEDRGAINAQANSLTMQRKVAGTPAQVASLSGKFGGIPTALSSEQPLSPSSFRRPLPGSMLDTTAGIDYKGIRVDTGAPGAARDAEMIRSTAGAGTGIPDHYFGATNAALAGAQAVEIAVIKAFEEFQTAQRDDCMDLVKFVLATARGQDIIDVVDDAEKVAFSFPPIATQDIVKWVTASAQWSQQVAPGNREVRMLAIRQAGQALGVPDLEQRWDAVEAEEQRIAREADAAKKIAQQQQEQNLKNAQNPTVPIAQRGAGGANGSSGGVNGNGHGAPAPADGGQRATTGPQETGTSPQIARLRAGRPPNEGATGPRSRRQ